MPNRQSWPIIDRLIASSGTRRPSGPPPLPGAAASPLDDDANEATGPASFMDVQLALWRMGLNAPSVIAMRSLGAAGFWNHADGEAQLMVREKQLAFAKATAAATHALWRGETPASVMLEAVKPLTEKTKANARRLSRGGPRLPGTKDHP